MILDKDLLYRQDCPCNWEARDDYATEEQYMLVYPQPAECLRSGDDRYSIKAVYDRYSRYTIIVAILMCRHSTSRGVYEHLTALDLPVSLVDFKKIGLAEDLELTANPFGYTLPTICFSFIKNYSKKGYLVVMNKYHSLFENYSYI